MPDGKKVSVTLPEGMTEEAFNSAFGTWQKQRVQGQLKGKATGAAVKRLIAKYEDEYKTIYDEEFARAKAKGVS